MKMPEYVRSLVARSEWVGWCDEAYLTPIEYCCHYPGAEISSEVGADGDVCKAPNHCRIGEADGKRSAGRAYERIRRVKNCPNNDALDKLLMSLISAHSVTCEY